MFQGTLAVYTVYVLSVLTHEKCGRSNNPSTSGSQCENKSYPNSQHPHHPLSKHLCQGFASSKGAQAEASRHLSQGEQLIETLGLLAFWNYVALWVQHIPVLCVILNLPRGL